VQDDQGKHLKCLILCAGLGTRLRPLTDHVPKPLATVFNTPLFDAALRACQAAGATDFAVNTHHLPGKMSEHAIRAAEANGLASIHVQNEPEILGTGGALIALGRWWGEHDLLVYNGDILSEIPLKDLVKRHQASSNLVTMAVRQPPPKDGGRSVWSNKDGFVRFISKASDLPKDQLGAQLKESGFACAYLARPALRRYLPSEIKFFDVIEGFQTALRAGEVIEAIHYSEFWADVGNPLSLWETNLQIANMPPAQRERIIGRSSRILAEVPANSIIDKTSVVASSAIIGPEAVVEKSVLLEGAVVSPGDKLSCVLRGYGFNEKIRP